MKKINLRGLSEKLSAKELKNVLGGSLTDYLCCCGSIDDPVGCFTVVTVFDEVAFEKMVDRCPNGGFCINEIYK